MENESRIWADILGCSWAEYTEDVRLFYEQNPDGCREDYLRDDFNALAGTESERLAAGVEEYYSADDGKLARICTYELGEHMDIDGLIASGAAVFTESGHRLAFYMAMRRFKNLVCLDHGCNNGAAGLYLASLGHLSVLYDYQIPMRLYVAQVVPQRLRPYVRFSWAPKKNGLFFPGLHYNFVVSCEVMEHTVDPVAEIRSIRDNMVRGGILYLSTFFNSCHGKNPSHLEEHSKYQDAAKWFREVENAGFRMVGRDDNGSEKIWERI